MKYIVQDATTGFYLAANPTPTIPYLLREEIATATQWTQRQHAINALEIALAYFKGGYTDCALVVKPYADKRRPVFQQLFAEIYPPPPPKDDDSD